MKNKPKLKFKSNFLILIIITIIVMVLALKDDFNDILDIIVKLNIGWLIVALILMIAYWGFRAISIIIFARKFNDDYKTKDGMELVVATQFFNAITPFASGGQPFQVYMLTKNKIRTNEAINIVAVNFICYQIALVFMGLMAILSNHAFNIFAKVTLLQQLVTIGFIVNVSVIILTLVLVFSKQFNQRIAKWCITILNKIKVVKNREETIKRVNNKLGEFHKSGKILLQNKKDFILCILYNVISISCLYLVPLAVIFSIGNYQSINAFATVICSSYTMMMGSFVPLPGGTGGIEFGFIKFFGNFLNGAILKTLMLMWRFLTYYLGMFLGAITFNLMERRR